MPYIHSRNEPRVPSQEVPKFFEKPKVSAAKEESSGSQEMDRKNEQIIHSAHGAAETKNKFQSEARSGQNKDTEIAHACYIQLELERQRPEAGSLSDRGSRSLSEQREEAKQRGRISSERRASKLRQSGAHGLFV